MSSPPNPAHGVDDPFEGDGAPDPAAMDELRRQLADTDPSVVIANHAYGLFELAAVYLSTQPPRLAEAQLAIDALAGLCEAVGPRLGEATSPLVEALAQIRLAWVQLSSASASDEASL